MKQKNRQNQTSTITEIAVVRMIYSAAQLQYRSAHKLRKHQLVIRLGSYRF